MTTADLAAGLDPAQLHAVTTDEAPLRILAGPGSGKTRVLTRRIARRVADGSADPRHVLALTFTRKAASELRDRLGRLGIRDLGGVGTFHAIASAQLRQHAIDAGRRPPVIVSGHRRFVAEAAADARGMSPDALAAELLWVRHQGGRPTDYATIAERRGRRPAAGVAEVAAALKRFQERKRRAGVIDLDDLLGECAHLMATDRRFADAQRWRFRHLFVDEFQDVNRAQFRLLREWLGDRADLCVVGDADQAIYGWNGADASFLVDFERWFPDAATARLTVNHRCAAPIARAAAAVLGLDPATTVSGDDGGELPEVSAHDDEWAEARAVVDLIRRRRPPGGRWGSVAVLARTNEQLAVIDEVLGEAAVPRRIRTRSRHLGDEAAQELLRRLTSHPGDVASLVEEIRAEHDRGGDGGEPPGSAALDAADDFQSDHPGGTGPQFGQWLRTVRPADLSASGDAVELCTFHSAKGLEWPHVVIVGAEDGLVPLRASDPEERRLLYVGLTRAERTVHLTWARQRRVGGVVTERSPSPFLAAIEAVAVPEVVPPPDRSLTLLNEARNAVDRDGESARLRRLKLWRAEESRRLQIPEQAILKDDIVRLLARAHPTTPEEVRTLADLTESRATQWSPPILRALHSQQPP